MTRRFQRFSGAAAAVLAGVLGGAQAGAATAPAFYTESFSGATASNAGLGSGVIAGTGLEVLSGPVWVAPESGNGQGNFLDLGSGWYAGNFDPTLDMGSSTVRSVASFDLIAGQRYELSFDRSRQLFSAGNGPFSTALTASIGSASVRYDDVAGFYYGADWQPGSVIWQQATTELGARVVFTASGPAGYSGMAVDNIALVGLGPVAAVPEASSAVLMLAGLAGVVGVTGWGGLAGGRRPRR